MAARLGANRPAAWSGLIAVCNKPSKLSEPVDAGANNATTAATCATECPDGLSDIVCHLEHKCWSSLLVFCIVMLIILVCSTPRSCMFSGCLPSGSRLQLASMSYSKIRAVLLSLESQAEQG